jgi:hypothetical protein
VDSGIFVFGVLDEAQQLLLQGEGIVQNRQGYLNELDG